MDKIASVGAAPGLPLKRITDVILRRESDIFHQHKANSIG
jgi:hypothetical protein